MIYILYAFLFVVGYLAIGIIIWLIIAVPDYLKARKQPGFGIDPTAMDPFIGIVITLTWPFQLWSRIGDRL